MDLSTLKPAKGSTKARKRVGRGQGSGKGGTSTRGTKGQKSRSGASIPAWFEGGQMPLQRRVPKFGFKNRNRTEYRPVNLTALSRLVEEGRIDSKQAVTPEVLVETGVVKRRERIKILGTGELSAALEISAHAFSSSAREKIEAAGGRVVVVE